MHQAARRPQWHAAALSALQCKSSVQAFKAGPSSTAAARTAVHVVAQKRVAKKQQVRLEPPAWSLLPPRQWWPSALLSEGIEF
jgi:hypothetical protein